MTIKMNNMRDADMPLIERIDAAMRRISNGEGQMRVPVEATDPDIVLSNCRDRILELESEVARLTPIDGIYQAFLVFAANPTPDAAVEFTEQAVKIAEAAADAQAKKVQA